MTHTLAGRFFWTLVDNRDDRISWMRNNCTENTGNITSSESNHQLFRLDTVVRLD